MSMPFPVISTLAMRLMAVIVLIPLSGSFFSFCRIRRPLRIAVLAALLAHVFRSRTARMTGVARVTISTPLAREHCAAISENNTRQQYCQAFMHG
jgi:hypothetical protein